MKVNIIEHLVTILELGLLYFWRYGPRKLGFLHAPKFCLK